MAEIYLTIILAPLVGAIIVGFFGRLLGEKFAHSIAILGVLISTLLSFYVFYHHVLDGAQSFNQNFYTWAAVGNFDIRIGFLIDDLTAVMMLAVSFVSLIVHIYTIGYMQGDAGYTRFFSYISLFTFAMLMLVSANNFFQLFFGWEAVGLVSYLLIGFWHHKDSANEASLKAFLVNRIGDFGFLLGIALVAVFFGTLDYSEVFSKLDGLKDENLAAGISLVTVICLLLFVGAMGKSAQMPLHVWLPGSMEGPTPISALIHAATMVTAGIFMVARMSPIYELSETALIVVMIIGAATAILMGILGIVQNDIKRIVAYSTLSQLGYMTAALGVGAYSVAIFHLLTHAFFKALLFLAAGSVIVALHHEQNIQKMGGLAKKMPVTYATALIGTFALIGAPGFAGFFSKDMMIEAAKFSALPFSDWVYAILVLGVGVTAFYSLRLIFLVFHGKPRMDDEHFSKVRESPFSITASLVILSIPSIFVGYFLFAPIISGAWFSASIAKTETLQNLSAHFDSALALFLHAPETVAFWMMVFGVFLAWILIMKKPEWTDWTARRFSLIYRILRDLYGFDRFNDFVFVRGVRTLGGGLYRFFDRLMIDGFLVNGTAKTVAFFGALIRTVQTGYVYHYAFFMIMGVLLILSLMIFDTEMLSEF